MPIKGGASRTTIFDTINMLLLKGLTIYEAISEMETTLRCQLPDDVKDRIYQECG